MEMKIRKVIRKGFMFNFELSVNFFVKFFKYNINIYFVVKISGI